MSPFQIFVGFDKEVRQYKPDMVVNTTDTVFWLNKAINTYVDILYKEGLTSEKNKKALEALMVSDIVSAITVSTVFANAYEAVVPVDMRYCLSDEAEIVIGGVTKRMPVKEITYDKYNEKIFDPFSEHLSRYGEAFPLKLVGKGSVNGNVTLITDGTYTITNYRINGYIKNPTLFTVATAATITEYTQFNTNSQRDIINLAVKMYLENDSNPRYQQYKVDETNK
jgi:hypothetical protein